MPASGSGVGGGRGIAWRVGAAAREGWGTPAGGGNEISRKSPPVWISAPAAAAAVARSAVGTGGGAETGFDAGCAAERGRRDSVRPLAAAGVGCRAAAVGTEAPAAG